MDYVFTHLSEETRREHIGAGIEHLETELHSLLLDKEVLEAIGQDTEEVEKQIKDRLTALDVLHAKLNELSGKKVLTIKK